MSSLRFTACVDSDELARQNQRFLGIRYEIAKSLGRLALEAIDHGEYLTDDGLVCGNQSRRSCKGFDHPRYFFAGRGKYAGR